MPTPKTPLPELLTFETGRGQFMSDWDVADVKDAINGILTYLKEQKEAPQYVLDVGKLPPDFKIEPGIIIPVKEAQPEKPGLKETLITELYDLVYSYNSLGYEVVARTDVESIINQVFRDNAN